MKKHKIHSVIALFGLSVLLSAGSPLQTAAADARGTGYHDYSEYLPKGLKQVPKRSRYKAADELPALYDPRKTADYLTDVYHQQATGCCWAFSTLDSSVMSSLKRGTAESGFSLSVWQLAYFYHHWIPDPMGLTAKDQNISSVPDYVTAGGNALAASFMLAQGISPAPEEVAPFEEFTAAWKEGKGDASLSADKAYQGYRLQEAIHVLPEDFTGMKRAILKYGAGAFSYCGTYHTDSTYWNSDTSALYIDAPAPPVNHAVTVVGWDDNFPKENFGKHKPDKDGAWLLKNTWGDQWGDGGYFWISYYDKSSYQYAGPCSFFSITSQEENEHLYQYDGTININFLFDPTIEKQANVFQSQGDEEITEVSFFTLDANVNYTVEVYKGSSLDQGDPTGGAKPLFQKSGSLTEQGYFSIPLEKPIPVSKGEYFSVVLHTERDGYCPYIPVDSNADYDTYHCIAHSEPGESYIFSNGKWSDLYDPDHMQNLRIKACTRDREPGITFPDLPNSTISLTEGDTLQLSAQTVPAAQKILWNSSDASVVSVSDSGMLHAIHTGTAKITASFVHQGQTLQTQIAVTVTQRAVPVPPIEEETEKTPETNDAQSSGTIQINAIRLSLDSPKVAPKKSFRLNVSVLPANASSKTLVYTSSNPKYASVDKNGILKTTKAGAGKTVTITAASADGSQVKGTYTIQIQKKAVKKVRFRKKPSFLKVGKKVSLKAYVTPKKGTNTSLRYTSSNPNYAAVNNKGKVIARKAGKGKKVTITAFSRDGSGKKARVTLKIK